MICGAYLPFKKESSKAVNFFEFKTPVELLLRAIEYKCKEGVLPETLVIFESFSKNLKVLPENKVVIQPAELMAADAFICNSLQEEAYPEVQAANRKHAELYVEVKGGSKPSYEDFVKYTREAFEIHILPAWTDVICQMFKLPIKNLSGLRKELDKDTYDLIREKLERGETSAARNILEDFYKEEIDG